MTSESATRLQAMLARCNFRGSDLPDSQFAAKEALRSMATPCGNHLGEAVRIGRYLNGVCRRLVQQFPLQKW